ncbi:MAG: MerR family transcriptional regulator [Aggregatilineales bacterium]
MTQNKTLLSVGAFAKRVGVSVRTLQYYDKIGLFKPNAHTTAGRRLYSEQDFARFQQIITLKRIGLSLADIKGVLTTQPDEIPDMLARQKQALKEKVCQLQRLIRTIESVEKSINTAETFDMEQFVHIIMEVHMSNQTNWIEQFLTDGQQEDIRTITQGTLEEQKQLGEMWKQLFQDIQAHLAGDPDHNNAQELLARWQTLMKTYTKSDVRLQATLENAYSQITTLADAMNLPEEVRNWLQQMQVSAHFASQTDQHEN